MRKVVAFLVVAASIVGLSLPLKAARQDATQTPNRFELLVIEVSGCYVCKHVRTYIQPAYEATPNARDIPMRYVDITRRDELTLGLRERVATVPTIVLMRDGREVDRVTGYLGPQNFMSALSVMLEGASD